MATKLHHFNILPSFSSSSSHIQELTLPLTHFDIPFLQSEPAKALIFYEISCSKQHFLETILPSLKKSLSATLAHFLPLAGNILLPSNSGMPVIRYVSGDSVSLTVAQSDQDFSNLVGHHQRVADDFYPSVPDLPPPTTVGDAVAVPIISFQITLFPLQGICIGFTIFHAVGDGSSMVNIVKSWALINKFGEDFYRTDGERVPVLDRNLVPDPRGLRSKAWNFVKNSLPLQFTVTFPIDKVRSTFILKKEQVQNLKKYASTHMPNSNHISSLAVVCAYIWTCAAKSDGGGEDDEEADFFVIPADCRRRLDPPLPAAYFGNCDVAVIAESRRGLLKRKEGFLTAVESIVEAIRRVLYGEEGVLESAKWPLNFAEVVGKFSMVVAGAPRFDFCEADFGWGEGRKYEIVHLDRERSISLAKSREFEGGFEVGLSRSKVEMDAFQSAFHHGLQTNSKI